MSKPKPPKILDGNDVAIAKWKETAVSGMTAVARDHLAVYCHTWARYVEATERLAEEGEYCINAHGNTVRTAWAHTSEQCQRHLRATAAVLQKNGIDIAAAPKEKAAKATVFNLIDQRKKRSGRGAA